MAGFPGPLTVDIGGQRILFHEAGNRYDSTIRVCLSSALDDLRFILVSAFAALPADFLRSHDLPALFSLAHHPVLFFFYYFRSCRLDSSFFFSLNGLMARNMWILLVF